MLGEGAEAEVWERYASEGEGLFNGVVELVVGDGANLRYVCEQELSDEGWVFATQRAEVGRDANLEWVALGFGSARGKVRMETKLAGRGLERARSPAPTPATAPSTSTTTPPRSTRPRTRPPTSPSAACWPSARPRSGAG